MNIISYYFFFFNDTATTEIYTLSLHDALPISLAVDDGHGVLERQLLEVHRRQLVHAVFGEIAARLGVDQLALDQVVALGVRVEQVRADARSEEHTSELQSPCNLVCRLLLAKKNT